MLKKILYILWILILGFLIIFGLKNGNYKTFISSMENRSFDIRQEYISSIGLRKHDNNIVIVAIGRAEFLKEDMVKDGVVVIDVGINRGEDGKLCGDVDFENVSQKASYITPVPGGVGPMTIAMLMNNVIKAAKNK